jgi:hypothetical protein
MKLLKELKKVCQDTIGVNLENSAGNVRFYSDAKLRKIARKNARKNKEISRFIGQDAAYLHFARMIGINIEDE